MIINDPRLIFQVGNDLLTCLASPQVKTSDGVVVGVNKVFFLKERLPFPSGPQRKRDVNSPRAAKQFRGDEGIWEATAPTRLNVKF